MEANKSVERVCFVLATEEGKFPAVPQKRAAYCKGQLETCKKYKPSAFWTVFEIVKVTETREDHWMKEVYYDVKNADPCIKETLFKELRQRYNAF